VDRPLVSLVIPAYNEADLIERSLRTILAHLATLEDRFEFEVLVVDDGSTDDTAAIAQQVADTDRRVSVLRHRQNFDLGAALQYGFGISRGDYVVAFDADLTYSPDHIDKMLDTITSTGAKIVIASPYMEGGRTIAIPKVRELLSRGANKFLSFAHGGNFKTMTGMVRAYDGPFIRTLDVKAVGPDINTEIIRKAKIMRAKMVEIPAVLDWTEITSVRGGRGNRGRLYWNTAQSIVSGFLFRPYAFFFVPGLLAALTAVGLGGWALVLTIRAAGDHRDIFAAAAHAYSVWPLVFLGCAVATIVAVQLISVSVTTFQTKRYSEELFHLGMTIRRAQSNEPELQKRYR
jgi:glycosyltransferase involved in cell wall biosynthesis